MGPARLRLLIGGAAAAVALASAAHGLAVEGDARAFTVVVPLLLAGAVALYARGVARLWRRAGVGRGIRIVEAARFALGMLVLVVALASPLDRLAERSFALHMIEHELLMVLAAPLLVLARPLEAWTWALAPRLRLALVACVRARAMRTLWSMATRPVAASCMHALALWLWHLPMLFAAALASEGLHVLQHACFFGSALVFWWAMFGGAQRTPGIASLGCLFATMLHTSVLGALLTFAPAAGYVPVDAPRLLGLTSLEDQQLGGLIMWVPGGFAYVVAGLAVVASWLANPRVMRNDALRQALPRREHVVSGH